MKHSKRVLNLVHTLRSNWIKCLCVLALASTGVLMAGDVSEGDCREHDGTQYACSSSGWDATSGESSCPAATPNDTCADEMVPGILGPVPGGPSGGTYDPSQGTSEPASTTPSPEQLCDSSGGTWRKIYVNPFLIISFCDYD